MKSAEITPYHYGGDKAKEKTKIIEFTDLKKSEIYKSLKIIDEIKLKSSELPAGVLRVKFKNLCSYETICCINKLLTM